MLLLVIVSLLMLGCPDDSGSASDSLVCDTSDGSCPTGSFEAVGANVVAFGVSETAPRGTAAIGDTLYMIGNANSTLYTVDMTNGEAQQVGDGSGLDQAGELRGLAAVGDTLYMIADDNDLFEIDTTTGMASDSSLSFGISGNHTPQGLAAVSFENEVFLLMATIEDGNSNVPTLYGLNTRTSQIAPLLELTSEQITTFPNFMRYMSITGVTTIGDSAFAVVNGETDALYLIDTSFANSDAEALQGFSDDTILTRLGGATAFGVSEEDPQGIAAVGDDIYMIGSGGLYRALTE